LLPTRREMGDRSVGAVAADQDQTHAFQIADDAGVGKCPVGHDHDMRVGASAEQILSQRDGFGWAVVGPSVGCRASTASSNASRDAPQRPRGGSSLRRSGSPSARRAAGSRSSGAPGRASLRNAKAVRRCGRHAGRHVQHQDHLAAVGGGDLLPERLGQRGDDQQHESTIWADSDSQNRSANQAGGEPTRAATARTSRRRTRYGRTATNTALPPPRPRAAHPQDPGLSNPIAHLIPRPSASWRCGSFATSLVPTASRFASA
jgi:hypothetical protein